MKILVVFYSFEGNTKLIAQNIAEETGADILELKPKKEIEKRGFMKYVWGGKAVMTKSEPELRPFDIVPGRYDVLFIGTPVWAWSYAPALNTFFSNYRISGKKIGLFCCYAGGKGGIFDKMKKALEGNLIAGKIAFKDPLKYDTAGNIARAKEWAKSIISSSGD